ncbi:MAG: hypothetical protein FWD02_02470 [Bacteroidales bacterium]|nr:hypothetical protein [Bacteroidales bacterium]
MTRAERLKFCRVCKEQKFDIKQGLVCGLTNLPADFETSCVHFKEDAELKAQEDLKEKKEVTKKQVGKEVIILIILAVLLIAQQIIRADLNRSRQRADELASIVVGFMESIDLNPPELSGEIIVNNIIIDAPSPFYARGASIIALSHYAMVPFQPIVKELNLEYEVLDTSRRPRVRIGNATFTIGREFVSTGQNTGRLFFSAPYIDDNGTIFVPLAFFNLILEKNTNISDEGQIIIEVRSDTH